MKWQTLLVTKGSHSDRDSEENVREKKEERRVFASRNGLNTVSAGFNDIGLNLKEEWRGYPNGKVGFI